jgi:hypothetical protein
LKLSFLSFCFLLPKLSFLVFFFVWCSVILKITPYTRNQQEEEKAADDWERKIASVLVSHEFGIIFEALADGMKSRIPELRSACFISATWLIYMLTILPDTGIQGAARVCLLKQFVNKLNSAKGVEHKILSMLALNSFLHFSGKFHKYSHLLQP